MFFKLIVVGAPCPRLAAALAEAYQNESKSNPELESYYTELTKHTGQKIATITDVEFLYNTLEIEVTVPKKSYIVHFNQYSFWAS